MSDAALTVVDLFAGAGGLSTGVARACENGNLDPSEDVELHAVNHWEPAIQTHEQNHPWAHHYHAKIEELHPPEVVEPGTVDLLCGGPSCTHYSTARGGKPVKEQKRASGWHVLDWVEKLRPEHVLLENVPEFRSWGPIIDGEPTRDGSIFERWVGMLEALGYSVLYDTEDDAYGTVLNAADYGDAQSRERLFVLASRSKRPTPPEPTHDDADPDKPDRRPAAEIIDWSDRGTSIWTRDLEHARVQPLSETTMGRIAEGIRRHCEDALQPFADALEGIGPDELERLRERVVPAEHAARVAQILDEPFLVRNQTPAVTTGSFVMGQHGNAIARDVTERPLSTVAAGGKIHHFNTDSVILRQQSGGVPATPDTPLPTVSKAGAIGMATADLGTLVQPRNGPRGGDHSNALYAPEDRPLHTVTARNHDGHLVTPTLIHYSHGGALRDIADPLPTVATEKGGAFALTAPYLTPMYNASGSQRPRTRSPDRPIMTVPASKSPSGLATPYLVEYYGNSDGPQPLDDPLPTVTSKDTFALVVPECYPWGLDVRYRMLQPRELKQAQGFPADYELAGDRKKDITAQIGNAVPVNLAASLVGHLLADDTPSLSNFDAGLSSDPDAEVPDYDEVVGDD
ncbi:DNA cytosine methyltransferase [Halostella litorea]|uniref:DNA cytosine methyltransferase n=1 Tax=Halostella litorea TaxID=2528831 RepID=UPI001092FCD0|nr:DNA cytosine methyltransferase [Halostella litorea]